MYVGDKVKTARNILTAFILNCFFAIIEIVGGLFTKSISIISDGIHDLGDSISILFSYVFEKKSMKEENDLYNFGYKRYSLVGAYITNTVLIIGVIFIIINAISRLFNPIAVNYNGMIIFGIFGILINGSAYFVTHKGNSLNEKSINLHMFEDVLGWIVVLIGAFIIKYTQIYFVDSVISIFIATYIFYHAILNLKEISAIFLLKNPLASKMAEIRKKFLKIENIKEISKLQIWSIDEKNINAVIKIICKDKNYHNLKEEIIKILKDYGVNDLTIEIE